MLPQSRKQYGVSTPARDLMRDLPSVDSAAYPGFIEPCLPELWEKPPHAEQWVHEIKHDGYRIQVHLHDTGAKAYTRRGNDWSSRFKPILAATGLFEARSAILDGEVVVETATGHSDFGALQDDLGARRTDRLVFYAFDLLHLDGFDLRVCSLVDGSVPSSN
jgi:bifunctional non-homologous end joining protein LigD